MIARRRTTLVSSVLLVVLLATTVISLQRVDQIRTGSTLEEVLYISSPKAIKRLSLGYDGLMADIYWTRAVQYFGNKLAAGTPNYKLLGPLLEITTYLDPHLLVAYEFGANFLASGYGAREANAAIRLVEDGIRANPDEWRLYYDLGFIYYLDLHDYAKAADAFERGSKTSNPNPTLGILAANMAQHAGKIEMARALWITTLQTTQAKQIKQNAIAHLLALQVDQDVTTLDTVIAEFRDRAGRPPSTFRELAQSGMLPGIPVDPTGRPYRLLADGHVEVADPEAIPYITKGLPPGYNPAQKSTPGAPSAPRN